MNQYLAIFQIGPVQEFIQTARKTQDFWSGSFLLSFLTAKAIHAFGDKYVIFPDHAQSQIYDTATKTDVPWPRKQVADCYTPSIPNRFLAITDNDPRSRLEKAKKAVMETWQTIANEVRKSVDANLTGGRDRLSSLQEKVLSADQVPARNQAVVSDTSAIQKNFPATRTCSWGNATQKIDSFVLDEDQWNNQICNRSFEILYVWREKSEDEDYPKAYQEVEALLGARKASRLFDLLPAQEGYACSLCGLLTALNPAGYTERKQLRQWWEDVMRQRKLFRHRFRKGEHLCAVCTVKRLAPFLIFKTSYDVPSTSTMAATSFQNGLQALSSNLDHQELTSLRGAVDNFITQVVKAAEHTGEPRAGKLPHFFKLGQKKIKLLKLDGDWFFESFYEHPNRRENTRDAFTAWKHLKKIAGDKGLRAPSRYFALLAADGDSMGRVLSKVKGPDEHKELSSLLAGFAVDDVRKVLEVDNPGYVLYWGGDEGVAMLPLEDLLSALTGIREAWRNKVEIGLQKIDIEKATLSVGAVIVHHQYPLRSAIREVSHALEVAKGISKHRKDAWAVRILRRSGAPVIARGRWRYGQDDFSFFEPLRLLEDFQKTYQQGWLSPRWLADLQTEGTALRDPPPDWPDARKKEWWKNARKLFDLEMKRLILRHIDTKLDATKNEVIERIIAGTKDLNRYISGIPARENFHRHQDLCACLDLAHYIAKGGGR